MDKQQVLNQLRNAKEIYVIMSLCTKMPYVVCDKETFDDEVLLYFKEEDIRREGKRFYLFPYAFDFFRRLRSDFIYRNIVK